MQPKYSLDAAETERVLEAAIRTQAQVVLELPSYPTHTVNGFLISGDQKAMLMEITGLPGLNPADMVNATCQVHLYLDQRYLFPTEITAAPKWGETRSLAFARPRTINVMERRRFVRAKLAPSSKVTLDWARMGTHHRHSASLLNISMEGLACRIEDGAAAAIDLGEALQVSFQLPGHERPFTLQSSVCNKTPASADHTILGVQFRMTASQKTTLETLGKVLCVHTHDVNTTTEALV